MQLDLDNLAIDQLLPWRFEVRIGGRTLETRPPTLAELAVLDQFTREADMKSFQQILAGLFRGTVDLSPWNFDQVEACIEGYVQYFFERLKKKQEIRKARPLAASSSGGKN